MYTNLLKQLTLMSRLAIYLFVFGYSLTMVFGTELDAQRKRLNEISFEIERGSYSMQELFSKIESSSNFKLAFLTEDDWENQIVTIDDNQWVLQHLLEHLSSTWSVSFKRVNETISVSKIIQSKGFIEPVVLDQITISGTITDENGEALPGATIQEKGTTNGTITNVEGKFTLSTPEDAVLTISFVGYESQEIPLNGRSMIDLSLEPDIASLQEVVVVGYGEQKKSDITGSVASIPEERLEMVPNINAAQAIQGSIPGVSIQQTTSSASAGNANIIVRGRNSIKANNTPLVVIDGVPGGLFDINPNDIASIEVLKDASAAAIYGSRGANGVILITTKEGAKGKPKITYNGYYSTQRFVNLPDIMDGGEFYRFKQIRDQSAITQYETDRFESGDWTYWPDYALRNGQAQHHNISVSGASDKTSFYISGGLYDVQGLTVNDEYLRVTTRVNLETQIFDWLTYGTRTQLAYEDQSGVQADISEVFAAHPLGEVYDVNGNLTLHPVPYDPQKGNPLASTLYNDLDKSYEIFSNNYLNVDVPFIEGLGYRLNTGVRFDFQDQSTYMPRTTKEGFDNQGNAITNKAVSQDILVENILSYNRQFQKHSIAATLLYSYQGVEETGNMVTSRGFPSDLLEWYSSAQAQVVIPEYAYAKTNLLSQMARLNYTYDGKYLVTLTTRRDGYSGFGTKKKWGTFPSVALGWNIADEDFFPTNSLISALKLRASFGKNGNQAISAYQTIARLASGENANMVSLNNPLPGYLPTQLAQDNLGWETSNTYNIGLDYSFLEDRIQGDINIYKTNTFDLLLDRTISFVHGIASITQNIGETQNKGFEFSISSVNINRGDFTWKTMANASFVSNKIVSLYGELDQSGQEIDDIANQWFIGHPINVNFNYKWAGVWQESEASEASAYGQQPGFVKVEDLNNDGVINADDRQIIGQVDPKFLWGLTNTITYKNFTLNIFMHGVHGVTKENPLKNDHALAEVRNNVTYKNWWTPENPNTGWLVNHYDAQMQGGVTVPYFENASFVRVKDVSFAYSIPEAVLEKIGFGQFRIYTTLRNMFTFTKWEGLDPELVGQRATPLQKEYVIGLDFSF